MTDKVVDLGRYSIRVKLRRMKDDVLYFVEEMFDNIGLRPFQKKLLRKLGLSKPPIIIKPGKVQINSFAGIHSDNALLIVDEANNVPEEIP